MRKLMLATLLLVGAASSGCIFAVEDEGHPHHHHCYGCGHVYVKGTWR